MNAIMLCVIAAAVGIDVGYQPLPGGGMQYIIQLGPETIDAMRSGEVLQSDTPAGMKDIRNWQIMMGTGPLPQRLAEEPRRLPEVQQAPQTLPPQPAGKPISAESTTFLAQSGTSQQPPVKPTAAQPPRQETSARPWMPLILLALALFASLGGNVYLGWVAWEVRKRYLLLQNALKGSSNG
jgi:hypothetical protein